MYFFEAKLLYNGKLKWEKFPQILQIGGFSQAFSLRKLRGIPSFCWFSAIREISLAKSYNLRKFSPMKMFHIAKLHVLQYIVLYTSADITLSQSVIAKHKCCLYLCEVVTLQTMFGLTCRQVTHFKVYMHCVYVCVVIGLKHYHTLTGC